VSDPFIEAQRKRKRRTRWWREHIVLAYGVVISSLIVFYLVIFALDQIPGWLVKLGVGPSGVALVAGTISCGFGVLGMLPPRRTASVLAGTLCLMSGLVELARGFGLF
jgi:hypothetical protein